MAAALPCVQAALPDGIANNILYKKGYLDVSLYLVGYPPSQQANATKTTQKLNEAIADGYNNNLVVYFPSGTYYINDTLKAHTMTGSFTGMVGDFQTPREYHSAIVGSTIGARPVIKLVPNLADSYGFNDPVLPPSEKYPLEVVTGPKPLLEFRNWGIGRNPSDGNPEYARDEDPLLELPPLLYPLRKIETPDESYNQMLRGIVLDCSATPTRNKGAVGLHFYGAQGCSIENVKIIATNAHTGLRGLPSAGAGVVNLEIIGGSYGIDTFNNGAKKTGTASTVIAGLKLSGQTVRSVRSMGFAPLTIVGFEITPAANVPGFELEAATNPSKSTVCLIDGKITVSGSAPVAIDNSSGRNFYARNVYVTGTDNLVSRVSPAATLTAIGAWKRITEYSYCDLNTGTQYPQPDDTSNGAVPVISRTLVNGVLAKIEITNGITANVLAVKVPNNLISRHIWAALPSVDDPDAIDATSDSRLPVAERITAADTGLKRSAKLQAILDKHKKVFLPKGTYRLGATIKLGRDNILFGADRNLTRIEVDSNWIPSATETPIITTENSADATTYLGDLSIGVDTGGPEPLPTASSASSEDWFVALHWKAGRSSVVHIGSIYRSPFNNSRHVTNPHSLVKITNDGGGRWYFLTATKTYTSQHNDYRILKVEGTTEPLSFYAVNPEHPRVADTYLQFINASNVRIYSIKSEFDNDRSTTVMSPAPAVTSSVLWVRNCDNFAVYGHGAIRNGTAGRGVVEFVDSPNVLAALIVPQLDRMHTTADDTLREKVGTATTQIKFPDTVSLYKRGVIVDAEIVHGDSFYGPELAFASIAAEDGWVLEGATAGQGGSLLKNGTGTQALSIGDNTSKKQFRSILSFDTSPSSISANAEIVGASLSLRRGYSSVAGSFGSLVADIKTGTFGTATLEITDFQAEASATNVIPSFPIPAVNEELTEGELVSSSLKYISRTGQTQFRIRFQSATDNDNNGDILGFYSGENTTANIPILTVRYGQPLD